MLYFNEIRYGTHKGLDVLIDPEDNSIWVTTPTIEKLLGYISDTARKKLASKSLKAFAGKALAAARKLKLSLRCAIIYRTNIGETRHGLNKYSRNQPFPWAV